MTPPITTTATPDQSEKALQNITLMLSLDPEAQSETLARIIAATIHEGPGSALEGFAATGHLDPETMLQELNDVRVPLEREDWVDALGRYVLFTAGDRS